MGNDDIRSRPRCTGEDVRFVLAAAIRHPEVLDNITQTLVPTHFNRPGEEALGLLYLCLTVWHKQHAGQPPPAWPLANELRRIAQDAVDLHPALLEEAIALIQAAGAIPVEALPVAQAKITAAQLFREREVFDQLTDVIRGADGRYVDNLGNVLQGYVDRLGAAEAATAKPIYGIMPQARPSNTGPRGAPTNVAFIDEVIGHQVAPEVYSLLGPTGVGKSLLLRQISTFGAAWQKQREITHKIRAGVWVYISFEADEHEARVLSLACSAQIDHARLTAAFDTVDPLAQLSTTQALQPYEKIRWQSQLLKGETVPGERERIAEAVDLLDGVWRVIDLSGTNPDMGQVGTGGVEEMASRLDQVRRDTGREIAGYCVDYAGLAVTRHLIAKGVDLSKNETGHLRLFIDQCKRQLSGRFNAPGWIAHQLNGEANTRSPLQVAHHANASQCRLFAENAHFAFQFGTKDQATSCCQFTASKTRRASGQTPAHLVFIDGAVSRMVSAKTLYRIDRAAGRIVPISDQTAQPNPS